MVSRLVVIGSSWGGLHALGCVLGGLPSAFPAPVAIAQHRGPGDPELLAHLLQRRTSLTVRDADDKMPLDEGCAYLAPAGYHLLIEDRAMALSVDEEVHHSRPSVDVLFESAAHAFADRVIAVVLTGANEDGAAGLAAVARRGGRTCVQDPDEAERDVMPRAALAAVTPGAMLPLAGIAPWLIAEVDR
jgi:two-component system, chemotaxis family, protein-glutamate methylesterase/glutaminase